VQRVETLPTDGTRTATVRAHLPPYDRPVGFLEPVHLAGQLARLDPLRPDDHDGLVDAVRDGRLWELWCTSVPAPEQMGADVERRLSEQQAGTVLPFTVRRQDTGAVVGMTTFLNPDAVTARVEIGSTWLARSAQGTGVNAESKLLLLTHAFEALGCVAVEFRTHWLNHASRAAIARLGAKQDGVLRNHRRMPDGTLRDTVVFSVIESEWPAVRSGLRHRVAVAARRSADPS
jgi:N-acetyltransferase